jgi:hypothetical protein
MKFPWEAVYNKSPSAVLPINTPMRLDLSNVHGPFRQSTRVPSVPIPLRSFPIRDIGRRTTGLSGRSVEIRSGWTAQQLGRPINTRERRSVQADK